MNEILVTGAAGFIGFHLCQRLLARGDEVLGWDNLNSYYDVSLKTARLERLKASKGFEFRTLDISNREKAPEGCEPGGAGGCEIFH